MTGACGIETCGLPVKTRGYCSKHYTRLVRTGDPLGSIPRPNADQRFWSKVVKHIGGCWEWTGAQDGHGYGHFNAGGSRATCKYVKSYRWAYERLVGPIPAGMVIDHMCHNTVCVNPEHLRVVTQEVNSQNQGHLNRSNTSGYRGVSLDRRYQRYRAYLNVRYRQIYLGMYATAEEAAAVAAAARDTHYDLPRTVPLRKSA